MCAFSPAPRPPPVTTDADEADEAEPPLDTGEYFKVVVSRNDEEQETFDHLTIDAEAATCAVTVLERSEYILAEDIAQTGQALARRPAPGLFEVTPPLPVPGPARAVARFWCPSVAT